MSLPIEPIRDFDFSSEPLPIIGKKNLYLQRIQDDDDDRITAAASFFMQDDQEMKEAIQDRSVIIASIERRKFNSVQNIGYLCFEQFDSVHTLAKRIDNLRAAQLLINALYLNIDCSLFLKEVRSGIGTKIVSTLKAASYPWLNRVFSMVNENNAASVQFNNKIGKEVLRFYIPSFFDNLFCNHKFGSDIIVYRY